jgi:recombination protein RecA
MAKLKRQTEELEKIKDVRHSFHINKESKHVISTGSTLLDLAISGKRYTGGGIPGGILVEIFGGPGSGKTGVLVECCASAQETCNGQVMFLDPEARLDREYAELYGLELEKNNYHRPNTVEELFEKINNWETNPDILNIIAADSLAALSTELELDKGDKMGMRRAKQFSEGLRKTCRKIAEENKLILCSNQVRQGDFGDVTPGGKGIPFYASLRIQIKQTSKIELEKTVRDKKFKKVVGIESICTIIKNSIDDPYRIAPIRLLFGKGIDDVGSNLQWIKTSLGNTTYNVGDKTYRSLNQAIDYVEKNDLEEEVRNQVIELWEEIEGAFFTEKKPKKRFKIPCEK